MLTAPGQFALRAQNVQPVYHQEHDRELWGSTTRCHCTCDCFFATEILKWKNKNDAQRKARSPLHGCKSKAFTWTHPIVNKETAAHHPSFDLLLKLKCQSTSSASIYLLVPPSPPPFRSHLQSHELNFLLFSSHTLHDYVLLQPNTSALLFSLLLWASHSSHLPAKLPSSLSLSDFLCSCLPSSSSPSLSTALLCSPPHAPPQLQSRPPQQLLCPPWVPPPFWVDLQTLRNRNTSQCVCARVCVGPLSSHWTNRKWRSSGEARRLFLGFWGDTETPAAPTQKNCKLLEEINKSNIKQSQWVHRSILIFYLES